MSKILIIEDQTAVRDMLCDMINAMGAYRIVGAVGTGQAGIDLAITEKPNLVILDIMLPGLNGTEVLRRITKALRDARVLIFSGHQSPALVKELIQAGAHGFVEKNSSLNELRKGIDSVMNGGTYFGPEVAQLLREAIMNPALPGDRKGMELLTAREREILQLIGESNSTKEIAVKLGISAKTAENHRTNLMKKLALHDVASLVRFSIKNGLVDAHHGG